MTEYRDSDTTGLVNAKGGKEPDWGRYGLSTEQQQETERRIEEESEGGYQQHDAGNQNELFREDQVCVFFADFMY